MTPSSSGSTMTVREARAGNLGLAPVSDYLQERTIARELVEANRLMDARDWRSIDVSYMATEEIAREVLVLVRSRPTGRNRSSEPLRLEAEAADRAVRVANEQRPVERRRRHPGGIEVVHRG